MAKTIDELINSMKFGTFSCMLIFLTGVFYMGGMSQLNTITIVSTELRCAWRLTSVEASVGTAMMFLGMGVGSTYWGYICDKHGRKKLMVIGCLLATYFEILTTVSPNFYMYIILQIFVGVGLGSMTLGICYITEFIKKKHRGKSVISVEIFQSFGSVFVAVLGLLLIPKLGWRMFLLLSTIPSLLFLLMSPWLPESVRYLQNTGNYDGLVKIFDRISITNKVPMIPKITDCHASSKRGNIGILASKIYIWKMIIMAVVLTSSHAAYHGVTILNTEILRSGNFCYPNKTIESVTCRKLERRDYIQNILVTAAEFPGIMLPLVSIDVIGRRAFVFPAFLASAVCFLCLNIYCTKTLGVTILMFVLRILLTGLVQTSHVLISELFPTVVRASALGILSGVAKLSMIAVPFLVQTLFYVSPLATTIVFAGLCFLSAILIIFVPETKDLSLVNA